ncbi:MAG: SCP2 sterol-binding domain-containing protein [Thermodesulfobacteriota bacterium]|nr:SCP2 sterol-binding domain-containing protein [Thermodesulfobacteriota bacterium]
MAVFKDTDFLYEALGSFWQELAKRDEFIIPLSKADLVIKFEISDPPATIWVSPDGVSLGTQDIKPDITMKLSGDSCHAFWTKKLSLPVALAKRKIKARGNIAKVMKLLPVVKPAFALYPDHMAKFGL